MGTVKIYFDRRKTATREKTASVEVEISSNGVRKRYSTGVRVTLNQWKDGRVYNHPQAMELNAKIEEAYQKCLSMVASPDFAIGKVTNIDGTPTLGFIDWLEVEIKRRDDLRPNTIKTHMATLHLLQEWGKITSFKDLTLKKIMAFEDYMKSMNKKQSTIHGHHKVLKLYISRAIIQGLITSTPYAGVKISRGKVESRKYLTEEQRTAIESLNLTGRAAFVRDMFLLACYTGLAFADMVKVSKNDIHQEGDNLWLIDRRQKTGTQYKLMLLPEARAILERYEFNMNRISNQKANMYLKGIAVAAGLTDNLTMHMGRHTFATWALSKGVPIEVVSKMLAHSDITTTQIYAKVLQKEVDKGFELLKDR